MAQPSGCAMYKSTGDMPPTTLPYLYPQIFPRRALAIQGLRLKLASPSVLLSENHALPMKEERRKMLTESEQKEGEDV